jgi:hypothetical protein
MAGVLIRWWRFRFSTDRDDMGGTGNFNRESKTLYIGGVKRPSNGANLEVC